MSRICITALIGLPGAGKTTLCQQLLDDRQLPFNVIHISYDDLFPHKFAEASELKATSSFPRFKTERLKALSLIEAAVSSIQLKGMCAMLDFSHKISRSVLSSTDYVILFDDNNYYASMRYKIYQICRRNQVFFAQIYFPIDLASSLQRNTQRSKPLQVPERVIKEMVERFELPNKSKNIWESNTFEIPTNTTDGRDHILFEGIVFKFRNFMNDIFQSNLLPTPRISPPMMKQQHACTSLHLLDVMLRRRIKEILRDSNANVALKKDEAKRLNDKRKELLRTYSHCRETENLSLDKLSEICRLMN